MKATGTASAARHAQAQPGREERPRRLRPPGTPPPPLRPGNRKANATLPVPRARRRGAGAGEKGGAPLRAPRRPLQGGRWKWLGFPAGGCRSEETWLVAAIIIIIIIIPHADYNQPSQAASDDDDDDDIII